ncbi:MAG TPA: CdaR family protein, partial [Spirochaetia bacterium]|nr:CdaR family protein [Spirochaetia bacterium]
SVQIVGPQSRVSGIISLKTDPVDLSGKSQDFTERVGLIVPDPTVKVSGNELVQFHGVIHNVVVVKTIEPVDIVALDLDPTLRMQLSSTTGSIQVQGNQLDLENLHQGDATLDIECSKITKPGTYTLQTKPSVPRGLVVLSYTPETVTLTVTKGSTDQ